MATKKPLCNYSGVIKELQAGDNVGAGGSTTFIGLTDVPAAFTGQAGKFPKVNAGETALEFATLAGGGDLLAANNLSELTASAATARTNIGLGSIATQAATALSGTFVFDSLKLEQETSGFDLIVTPENDDFTADRRLNIVTNNADRTLTISGNATISGTNTGDQTLNGLLPTQTGNAGKVLQTDGANTSWQTASGGLTQPQVMARALGC
jgi:hypothetical protein